MYMYRNWYIIHVHRNFNSLPQIYKVLLETEKTLHRNVKTRAHRSQVVPCKFGVDY